MDVERLLEEGNTVQVALEGNSMYPFLVSGRDMAIIEPLRVKDARRVKENGRESKSIRRSDVVLYRRDGGILVLHRVFSVREEGFYAVGDNQTEVEGPLAYTQLRGRMVGFVRKGKEISIRNPLYQIYSRVWLFLRPVRHKIAVFIHVIKQKVSKKNG